MDEYRQTNRAHWDEATDVHVASEFYDVESFKAGNNRLHAIEREELGNVTGKSLLHLQCHFGLDTLSWARLGADVTGVDFSERAVEQARALSAETGVPGRFILSELYELPSVLDEQFDIVFTSYGAIYWLPDIMRWGEIAARYVKRGGIFYIAEFHPVGFMFDTVDATVTDYRLKYPYFYEAKPIIDDSADYADPNVAMSNTLTYSWAHSMSDIINALIGAGLQIEYFHEFPLSAMKQFPWLEPEGDDLWRAPADQYQMPMTFSIKARKP
jgi:ubiquinone/menaquinone biosynthesis C-methylase UbiE